MPRLTNEDIEKRATDIAASFWAGQDQGGATLTDLVAKVARDLSLQPEQISRLARRTNIVATEAKYAALANEKDRVPDFKLADDQDVLAQLHGEAALPTVTKSAAALYPDLPDAMATKRGWVPPAAPQRVEEKLAAIEAAIGKEEHPAKRYQRTKRAAEEMEIRVHGARQQWEHTMDDVLSVTRRVGWDHDAFEKAALALHGSDVLPELNALRVEHRMAPLSLTQEKVAALQDRLVADETPETRRVKKASDARREYLALDGALVEARVRLRTFHQEALDALT